jgi:tetratricopeptide (TPR) repeat protein
MLAIKNCGLKGWLLLAAVGVLLAGCMPPGPRALLEGKSLLEQRKYDQAVEQLRDATALLPTNALAWEYLGLACQYAGQAAEADKAYHRALVLDHKLTEAHYNLGCLSLAQDKFDAAKAEFTIYTLSRADAPDGFLKLGETQLRAALRENSLASRTHELNAADKSFGEALHLNPQSAEALNGQGLIRVYNSHWNDAAQYFNVALKHQPGYAPSLLNLAIVEQQGLRNLPVALQKYQEYLALIPAPANVEPVRAVVRQLEQDVPLPARPVETNAAPPPKTNTSPAVHFSSPPARVEADTESNPPEPELKPAHQPAHLPAPEPEPIVQPAKPAFARYHYQSPPRPVAAKRAEHAAASRDYAEALRETNHLAQAAKYYRAAMQSDPAFFEAAYNLALTESLLGNARASLSAYEHALAIRPESPEARYNFALVLEQANYPVDAANELEKLLAGSSDDVRAQLALGNLYAQKLKQPAKAREHYLQVLQAQPNHPQAASIRQWLAANSPSD